MRFALFIFKGYYPDGGWSDFRRVAKELKEARPGTVPSDYTYPGFDENSRYNFLKSDEAFAQVVDLETLAIVEEYRLRNLDWVKEPK